MDSTINIVQIINNELYVSHRIIAENTENKPQNIKELIDDHKTQFELFGVIRFETEKGKGRPKVTYFLNEAQATLLLTFMRNNQIVINFKVMLVQNFYKMREILKSQTRQQPQPDQNIVNNIFALEKSFSNLRPSQASKISMTEKLYQRLELETCYLPKYTEEKLTRSLTYLLKKYEIKISTQKANLKLLELGILEKMERDSACGKTKYFWSLTENGLKFGKNLISPKNERETQPHFFESKFLELVELF